MLHELPEELIQLIALYALLDKTTLKCFELTSKQIANKLSFPALLSSTFPNSNIEPCQEASSGTSQNLNCKKYLLKKLSISPSTLEFDPSLVPLPRLYEYFDYQDYQFDKSLICNMEKLGCTSPSSLQRVVIPLMLQRQHSFICKHRYDNETQGIIGSLIQSVRNAKKKQQPVTSTSSAICKPLALLSAPSRTMAEELYLQLQKLLEGTQDVSSCFVLAGRPYLVQVQELKSKHYDIIISTPGRMYDLITRGVIATEDVKYLVLYEADEIIGRGFMEQLQGLEQKLNEDLCMCAFAVTLPIELHKFLRTSRLPLVHFHDRTENERRRARFWNDHN